MSRLYRPISIIAAALILTSCAAPASTELAPEESATPEPVITESAAPETTPTNAESEPEAAVENAGPTGRIESELTDSEGYSFIAAVDYTVLSAYADPTSEKPGFTALIVPLEVRFSAVNTTQGRETTAPVGDMQLWAEYPAGSEACSVDNTLNPDGSCWMQMAHGFALALGDTLAPDSSSEVSLGPETPFNLAPRINITNVPEEGAEKILADLQSPSRMVALFEGNPDIPIVGSCEGAAIIGGSEPVTCEDVANIQGL